jgi:hypothetical protein
MSPSGLGEGAFSEIASPKAVSYKAETNAPGIASGPAPNVNPATSTDADAMYVSHRYPLAPLPPHAAPAGNTSPNGPLPPPVTGPDTARNVTGPRNVPTANAALSSPATIETALSSIIIADTAVPRRATTPSDRRDCKLRRLIVWLSLVRSGARSATQASRHVKFRR